MIIKNIEVAAVVETLSKEKCKVKVLSDGFKCFEFLTDEAEQVADDYYYALRNGNCFYVDSVELIDRKMKIKKRLKEVR